MQRPPAGHSQAEQLQKLILAANAGQLNNEQLIQLRQFLGQQPALGGNGTNGNGNVNGNGNGNGNGGSTSTNTQAGIMGITQSQGPPLQIPIPIPLSIPISQQPPPPQMVRSPAPYQGQQPASNVSNGQPQSQSNAGGDPRAIIQNMQQRIANIEQLLKRSDLAEPDRQKLVAEAENSKRNLNQFINSVKAAAAAQQQAQVAAHQAAQQGIPPNAALNELQAAQQRAMAQKAQALQSQMAAQQQAQTQAQQQSPPQIHQQQQHQMQNNQARNLLTQQQQQQQQQVPLALPGGLSFPPQIANTLIHRSPALQPQQLPSHSQQQQPQYSQQSNLPISTASPAMSAASPPSQNNQPDGTPQGASSRKKQSQPPHLTQQQQQGRSTPSNASQAGSAVSSSSSAPNISNPFPIPDHLNMPAYKPESFPSSRPTLSSGLATNPILGTPAITKPPLPNLPQTRPGSAAGLLSGPGVSSNSAPMAHPSTSAAPTGMTSNLSQPGPLALKVTEGRPYNKRKLQELVSSIDASQTLDTQVEELLLEVADEFVDSITRFACRLAKHRRSDRLECKDLNLVLEKTYNMQIPGFASDEVKQPVSSTRKPNLPAYQSRLAAVREAKLKK